ncbi:MAG: GNAT family N-acetyltransferase [Synergistaceae bacterium]|jgi:GNAT superfamily N-acetyltransferase|nr:GNAT family N-acetyltransferase [Synergistaceae bacterium]
MENIVVRFAVAEDVPVILNFIRELAAYEKLLDQVVATEEILHEWIFERKKAEALIVESDGEAVGYALFFHNFSTFLGRAGIYLEDLYVRPAARRRGTGRRLLEAVASIARERGCGRLEWSCLDWNEPSIAFYLSLGAKPMDDWTVYRMTGEAIDRLASGMMA